MRSVRMVRLSSRWLIPLVLVLISLAAGGSMVPRTVYLLGRADYHAGLERARSAEGAELRSRLVDTPTDDFLQYQLDECLKNSADHGRLKREYRRAAFRPWACPPRDLPLPYPWDTARDRAVLQAALADWLGGANREAGAQGAHSPSKRVVLDESASIEPFDDWDLRDILARDGFPTELVSDLERRNPQAGEDMRGLNGADWNVVFDDMQRSLGRLRQRHPDTDSLFKATLPGYSSDGAHALVALVNMVENHSPGAVCVLAKADGRWRAAASYRFYNGGEIRP
jgi:hypothetical protein